MVWLCAHFGVSPGGFYAWRKRKRTRQYDNDKHLLKWIRKVHTGRRKAYGSPRVYRLLRKKGIVCSRRRVARVMRENGIKATVVGLYKGAPQRRAIYEQADNVMGSTPPPTAIDQQWVADFTYIKTLRDGWSYLAVVLDRYSRKVVGWSFSKNRNASLTKNSLLMAMADRNPPPGLIFHTDRGIEYVANKFQETLHEAQFRPSMSGKARSLDNAFAETFFRTLKTEEIYQRQYKTHRKLRTDIIGYIDFYNEERLHSSLDYQSPMEYEKQFA